jgi:hypothetical protein
MDLIAGKGYGFWMAGQVSWDFKEAAMKHWALISLNKPYFSLNELVRFSSIGHCLLIIKELLPIIFQKIEQ